MKSQEVMLLSQFKTRLLKQFSGKIKRRSNFPICIFILVILFCSCSNGDNQNVDSIRTNSSIETVKKSPTPFTNQENARFSDNPYRSDNYIYSLVLSYEVPVDSLTFVNQETIKFDNVQSLNKLSQQSNISPAIPGLENMAEKSAILVIS